MSYNVNTNGLPVLRRLKAVNSEGANPAKQPYNGGATQQQSPGAQALAQVQNEMRNSLAGLQQGMEQIVLQLSPSARQRMTPELLANAALSYQNFNFRPGMDNPSAPPIDAENGSIEGPVVLKHVNDPVTTVGTVPVVLSIDVPLLDSDQTQTGGGRMITALGLDIIPSGAAAALPAGYDASSLKDTLFALGLVQVLTGSTIKAQYDARDLKDTNFVQRVLEQPIRVQKGNYAATVFRYVTIAAPPAAASLTYNVLIVFASYWPPIR